MGSGATSKQRKVDAAPAEASGYSGKTVSSPFSEFCTLEDEVKWLRFKLAEEQKEKELMMSRSDYQASSSSSCADAPGKRNEQEIIWLRRMFDAEKTEKAWVMARIEGLEAQLKTRSEECGSLRAALSGGGRQAGRGTLPPEQPAIPIAGSPARNKAWKEDTVSPTSNVVVDPIGPSQKSDPVSPGDGQSLSLKERRKLKLAISTGKAPLAVSTSGVVSGTNALMADSAAPLLNPQEALPASEPARLSTYSHNNPMEPMSPLLARRTGNRAGLGTEAGPSRVVSMSARPALVLGQKDDGLSKHNSIGLDAAKASKIACLEAPDSPKRKTRPEWAERTDSKEKALVLEEKDAPPRQKSIRLDASKIACLEAPESPKRRTRPEWAERKDSKEKAPAEEPMEHKASRKSLSLQQVPEDQVPQAQLEKAEDMLRQQSPQASEDVGVFPFGATMSMP